MTYTMTREDVQAFARQNQKAMEFLMIATEDYAAARCCLTHGLLAGLVLGAQTVEKYLKAFILFQTPTQDVRRLSHKITALATQASSFSAGFSLSPYSQVIAELERHYESRYPDNPNGSTSKCSSELDGLDEIVIFINEQMIFPAEVKYRSGFYSMLNLSLNQPGATMRPMNSESELFPSERWIKENNAALAPLLPAIQSQYLAVLNHLYPNP